MEVATAIGTTALSVSLEWLIKYLGSKSNGWWNSQRQVRDDSQNWKRFLPKLCAVLDDAEMRQTTNPAVELWLSELRDVAYDMEDVLDGLEADERRKKLTAKADQPSTSKARKLIPMCCTGFNKDDLILDREAVSKIKEISVRLERIVREKEALDLKVGEARRSIAAPRWESTATTTWLPEPHVYGREDDKDAILKKALNDEDGDENPCVIPIVGMGGLGKTTLARLVYNDARLEGVFELKAWVCVSDEFDILRITRSILEQITESKCDCEDPSVLQGRVNNKLSGKKFLLVLDDVWSEDYSCWDVLQRVFVSAAVGSKIIVTSRIKGVAKTMGASDRIYHLKELPEDQCLSLLARHALGRQSFDAHMYLKDIGAEIVKKCRGLPLAVKTLGGLLRGELNPDKWLKVLKSEIWELPEGRSHILPALRLSYHHLPAHLKKCFVYCAIFPKDYEFCKDDLILLWMAEGFVQQQKNGMRQLKCLGDEYFCDLLSRGLFQQSNRNQSYFVMHDLVHDLAQHVAGETCCNLGNLIKSEKMEVNFEKARHVSYSAYHVSKISWFLQKPNNLRTFLVLEYDWEDPYVDESYVEFIQKSRCPRVLSLSGWARSELPNSIEKLKHLRYIDLSHSTLQSLPSSVSSLVYLQTMKLYNCMQITELPAGIVDLVDLHHLDIGGTSRLQKMPPQMGNLKNLLMLPKFIVGESGGLRLKELNNLKDLQGELLIQNLHNVFDIQDASEANLFKMEGLEELTLEWNNDFQTSRDESHEFQVVSQLKPHCNLKRFTVNSYGGLEFPSWIGNPSFSKLEYLRLYNCKRSTLLPRLELPQLMRLQINGCPQLTYSPMSLPSLQELDLDDCKGAVLRNVFDSTSLTKLRISRISELTCLPRSFTQYMTALETLRIEECGELVFLLEDGDSLSSFSSLKWMNIAHCPLLVSLTDLLPRTLESLTIVDCDHVEHLPNGLHSLTSLKELQIRSCKKFVGFLVTDFPLYLQNLELTYLEALESLPDELMVTTKRLESLMSTSTLKTLEITHCGNLKSLPNEMYNCTSLQGLYIRNCPGIASIPGGGLPLNLKWLVIDCEGLKQSMLEWGLDRLTSLEEFEIHWICPPDDLLPTSLKTLTIKRVGNLESISKGLLQNLTSLRKLEFFDCPILKTLPEEGLPPSLEVFEIEGCPLLEQRCLKEKGDYWPLISNIRSKYIRSLLFSDSVEEYEDA